MVETVNTASAEDHTLAQEIAVEVGALLVDLRKKLSLQGVDQKTLKDRGDQAAHDLIVKILSEKRPEDSILSEEGADGTERLGSPRVWIVDPLDGTREFSEPPRTDWAVHIALVHANIPIAGAVSLPAQNLVFSTATPPGEPSQVSTPRVIVSRTRRPEPVVKLAEALKAEYIEMGSAGAKAMAVVQGKADIYAHSGGQYEWDSCAPVAVAQATGLHCSRLDGSPLLYNQENTYLPDLLICQPAWAEACLEILNNE